MADLSLVDPASADPESELFTPRLANGVRMRMRVSREDSAKLKRGRTDWSAALTDLATGIRYTVVGAHCSAGPHCMCDCVVTGVEVPMPLVDPNDGSVSVYKANP